MSSTILSEKLTERKTAEAYAKATEHSVAETRCYNIGSGYDCEVVCSCGDVAVGYSGHSKGKAYARAVEHFEEHRLIVVEHATRCPSDVGLEVR